MDKLIKEKKIAPLRLLQDSEDLTELSNLE